MDRKEEHLKLKYGFNYWQTFILIIDETKRPVKESLWNVSGHIIQGQDLSKYFERQGVTDVKSFGKWFRDAGFAVDNFAAGPYHHLYSGRDYFIKATLSLENKLKLEQLTYQELIIREKNQDADEL